MPGQELKALVDFCLGESMKEEMRVSIEDLLQKKCQQTLNYRFFPKW